ncbi:hypothetical protein P2318_11940 [Myxococcaceae bacterium GXIMD 01537]
MRAPRLPLLAPVLLALALPGLACRAPYHVQRTLPATLSASAVVVYPLGFRWDAPEWRSRELTQRLIDTALAGAGERALFFGPSEVKVYRASDDNAWAASNAVTVFTPYGIRPEAALVLRTWAEKRVQSGQGELLDGQGRTVGHSSVEEATYLGHVEVVHPSTQQVVLELTGEAREDPFAERTDDGADPAPELTRLMEGLVGEAVKALQPHLRAPREPSPSAVSVALVPWEAFDFGPVLARLDALDAEVLRQQRLRFSNPSLPVPELDRLARQPGGLYVLSAPPGAKLVPGDLILSLEGAPALPQALARARLAPVPVEAQVRRASGDTVPVLLP